MEIESIKKDNFSIKIENLKTKIFEHLKCLKVKLESSLLETQNKDLYLTFNKDKKVEMEIGGLYINGIGDLIKIKNFDKDFFYDENDIKYNKNGWVDTHIEKRNPLSLVYEIESEIKVYI